MESSGRFVLSMETMKIPRPKKSDLPPSGLTQFFQDWNSLSVKMLHYFYLKKHPQKVGKHIPRQVLQSDLVWTYDLFHGLKWPPFGEFNLMACGIFEFHHESTSNPPMSLDFAHHLLPRYFRGNGYLDHETPPKTTGLLPIPTHPDAATTKTQWRFEETDLEGDGGNQRFWATLQGRITYPTKGEVRKIIIHSNVPADRGYVRVPRRVPHLQILNKSSHE